MCHIRFAVKVKEHSNPDPNKGSKGSAGAYDFATAKPQSENDWTLNEARWAIENKGYSSSGENRINWIKWIYYSLVCHFSTELFCGRSARQVQRSTVFSLLYSLHLLCIIFYPSGKPNFSRLLLLLSLGWEAGYVHSWCRTKKTRNTLKNTVFIRISAQPRISAHLE